MVKYIYDAWGNHAALNADGTNCTSGIGLLNPFRYRSYYYDIETNLYLLKTRYYDPEIGRFINIDDISYLDPETINGLNLYAYCGNNPVMRIDSEGTNWWNPFSWDWGKIGISIGIGLAAVGLIALTVVSFGTAAPILAAGIIGGIAAFSINVITQGIDKGYGNIDWGDATIQTLSGIAYGIACVAVPGIGGMLLKAGIVSATSIASGIYHGDSIGKIALNAVLILVFQLEFKVL